MQLLKSPYIVRTLIFCALASFWSCSGHAPAKNGAEVLNEQHLSRLTITAKSGEVYEFKVELAKTPHEHMVGLMHRESLPRGQGMLFIFADDAVRSFWMKNTLIPLDMLFISSGGQIVGIVHEAEPLTLESRSVGQKSRYVLEINGGLCQKLGITTGDMADLKEITER